MGLYEDQTYEAIMARVLARVSDSLDKREGSLIYDATGPASAEIALLYIALDYMLECMFIASLEGEVSTAIYDWLVAVHTAAANKLLTVGGAVKALILDSEYSTPTPTLIENVQDEIDPTESAGEGVGTAPIGHVVTIAGPSTQTINVTFGSIDYQSGYDWDSVKAGAEAIIEEYLLGLRTAWQESDTTIVRISRIESLMLNCTGIVDIGGAKINGTASNLTLAADIIPVRGTVGLEV